MVILIKVNKTEHTIQILKYITIPHPTTYSLRSQPTVMPSFAADVLVNFSTIPPQVQRGSLTLEFHRLFDRIPCKWWYRRGRGQSVSLLSEYCALYRLILYSSYFILVFSVALFPCLLVSWFLDPFIPRGSGGQYYTGMDWNKFEYKVM